jgi:tetratricopeptide (TPR) repeat protein
VDIRVVVFFLMLTSASFCSLASAAPTVIKKIPANLLGDASRQNVFVLTGDSDEAYHRLLIAPEQGTSDEIMLDTSKALPLVKTQYSSVVNDGFSVNVINGQSGRFKIIDQQLEQVLVKQSSSEAGDYIALVTNEENNHVYNFNLLFRYNKSSKKFELKDVLQVTNNTSCDRSILSIEELPKGTISEVSLESFDGRKVLQQLQAIHVKTPSAGYKKLMTIDAADLLDQALALYRKGDARAFKDVMGYALMGGGADDVCDPQSYIVRKYYFAQMPGWSNDLGFLLGEAGYYAESIELLKAVIANNPGRIVAYLNLADSYWGANDKERAAEAYKQYGSLMFGAGKASKIPTRVGERSNGA